MFEDTDKDKAVVTEVKLMDIEKKKVSYDKLTFIYLQMLNFNKTEDELETHFDKWLYVIKNLPRLQDRPARLQERVFEKLFRLAEIEKFDYKERMEYEDSLKVYRDLKNSVDTAKEEGRAEGEKIGRLETAKNLLSMGILTTEQVAQATGLEIKEIVRVVRVRMIPQCEKYMPDTDEKAFPCLSPNTTKHKKNSLKKQQKSGIIFFG